MCFLLFLASPSRLDQKMAAPNEELDISKNNLLVFMYTGEE